jgi:hypothetical protein
MNKMILSSMILLSMITYVSANNYNMKGLLFDTNTELNNDNDNYNDYHNYNPFYVYINMKILISFCLFVYSINTNLKKFNHILTNYIYTVWTGLVISLIQ